MLVEVLVKLLGCLRGQVVDLAAYHEEDREQILRDNCEDKCFECETMEKEGDHVDQEYELKSPDFKAVGIECFVSSEMYNLVVYLPVESLGYPIENETHRDSYNPGDEETDSLMLISIPVFDIL